MPDGDFTVLTGPRVMLRRFQPADGGGFVAYRSSAAVARFQSWDAPYPRAQGERFIQEMMARHPDTAGGWFQFAVALLRAGARETRGNCFRLSGALPRAGSLIGDCAAMTRADAPRQCEIGFTIAG